MESALGLAGAAPAAATDVDTARLAAEVAARVAAQVADETIARLVAAGWAPGGGRGAELPPQRIILETRGGAPQESVVRVVTEAAQPSLLNVRYDLPGGSAAAAYSTVAPAMSPSAAAPAQPSPTSTKAHAAATAGYAAIRAGDLQEGVRLLKAAQAMDPDAPEAAAWGADVKQLTRRWSVGAYALSRAGTGEALAASPVLGGGQIGAAIACYEPFRSVPLAVDVERRFALGVFARDAWAARVSGGAQGKVGAFGRQLALEGYGEAGVVEGFTSTPDVYAGAQMRGAVPLFQVGRTRFDGGAGLWGAVQRSFDVTASRLDVGPSARIKVEPWPFHAQIDYRARVAGNALPGSGPVLTVAGEF
jgi:hypothetical protein